MRVRSRSGAELWGPASDIYALGVVLFRLLTGRLPYAAQGGDEVLTKPSVASDNRQLEGDMDSIVLKALCKEPGERYVSVAEFSEDVDRFLQDRPVRARRTSLPYRGRKLLKRTRVTALLAGGLLAASVLALVPGRGRGVAPSVGIRLTQEQSPEARPSEERPPEKAIPVLQAAPAPKTLAVVHIESLVKDASVDRIDDSLCDLLTASLAHAKGLQVISAGRVRELAARRTQGDSRLSADQARDVAREAHADLFLSGALIRAGAGVRLEFQVHETATGRVLFADQVERSDPQAIFSMADQASAGILARLVPGQTAPKSTAGALTANLEALFAYEEGLANRARFRAAEARRALRRAIDLDPQFAMAHYQLADSMRFDGNVPEARRSTARAVHLAEHAPIPRFQKIMIQALQMRLDSRLDEAAKILEVVHHEFPQEVEPLYQLAIIRALTARFAESATLLEEVVRTDGRHAVARNQLGYEYAFLGDVARAVASVDRYAELLPPGNEAPISTRGDVYTINAR